MRILTGLVVAILALLAPAAAGAQIAVADRADPGDTAWIMAASALALLVTLSGIALYYGGFVRFRNVLSVGLQIGASAAAVSVLWVAAGYSLAFGPVGSGWLGGLDNAMLNNLGYVRAGFLVPESAFALFQMTLPIIAAALMVGAWAERARFGWAVAFCSLWSLIVYAPVAHWLWGGGWLSASYGTLDFAGGLAVHTTSGVSALVIALLIGRRGGFTVVGMPTQDPVLTMAGAALFWAGWFGISGGAALAATDDASSAIVNAHVAACVAALVWAGIERFLAGKATGTGFATGIFAGLAAVVPAAGFISPGAAIVIGAVAAAVCYGMVRVVRQRLNIDDAAGVFAVHGVGGAVGTLLLAVFLSPDLGGTGYAEGQTMAGQLAAQMIGVGVVALYAAVASAVLAVGVSLIVPMRVSEDEETAGLDRSSHGEDAWTRGA